MNRTLALVGCCVVGAVACAHTHAGYMMGITHAGNSSASVLPGDSIQLDVAITADGTETHNSAIFRVEFSAPGLRYDGYEWTSPYLNNTLDDDSKPLGGALPLVLDEFTLTGVGYPAGAVDVELSNVLPIGPDFGSGILARLTLTVPETYVGAPEVQISLVPDEIALNGSNVSTRTMGFFNLIIPSPSVSAMFLVAALGVLNRDRRR